MPKKIYFSTTEILPFANVSNLAAFSTAVPTILQDLGHDIRTILPKYGFISESK
jgi:starch synthase